MAETCNNIVVTPQRQERPTAKGLGINTEKPKFPQYALVANRLASFEELSWSYLVPVTIDDLVEAGLVYTGVDDSVRCYHCGGGLRNWELGDDPMVEHARWYPNCAHVLLNKGQKFVQAIAEGELATDEVEEIEVIPKIEKLDLKSTAAQAVIQMGFSTGDVSKAIQIFIKRKGNVSCSGTDLCEILFELEEDPTLYQPDETTSEHENNDDASDDKNGATRDDDNDAESDDESDTDCNDEDNDEESGYCTDDCSNKCENVEDDVEKLIEENERLKENQLCKICLDKNADVIFLPCGHMVSCAQCAPALNKCPICRKLVNGLVKAFFATAIKSS